MTKQLTIYYTSDIHGAIFPSNFINTHNKELNSGLLSIAPLMTKDQNTLVIDGGDTIQGSSLTTYLMKHHTPKQPSFIAKALNRLNYDYVTLGNHDFNYGEAYLIDYLTHLNALPLCSNVTYLDHQSLIMPYDIKTLGNGLRVGIIGGTTQHINVWENPEHIKQFRITDPYTSIKQTLETIKDKIDVSIVIYHGGFEADLKTGDLLGDDTGENQAYQLAHDLNIDLLLTGHQHFRIHNTVINGTHVVQTPPNATELCKIEIKMDLKTKEHTIDSSFLIPPKTSLDAIDSDFLDLYNQLDAWLEQSIGTLKAPLDPRENLDMALHGSGLVDLINQIQLDVTGANISCTSLANKVSGLPQNVRIRDVLSTYIYPNTLLVLEITGKQLKQALERCAEYFTLVNGQPKVSQAFLQPKVEHYNYDYFKGIEYVFNLRKPVNHRVELILYQDKVVSDHQTFRLALNSYRASGTGGYDVYQDATILKEFPKSTSELVIDYLSSNKETTIKHQQNVTINY